MCNSQLIPAEAPVTFKMGDVDVFEQDGQFWFRIQDVAKCLEYSSPDNWNRWFREGDTRLRQFDGVGNLKVNQKYMRESALYRVLVKCNVPKAEPFERWVTEEVLPSIRKTGSYSTASTLPALPSTYIEALEALLKSEKEKAALQMELDTSKEWYTIKRVAEMNHVPWQTYNWRTLKSKSIEMGIPPKKIFDANYGEVNLYHCSVWEVVYPEAEL